jgi:hypothetical protein
MFIRIIYRFGKKIMQERRNTWRRWKDVVFTLDERELEELIKG